MSSCEISLKQPPILTRDRLELFKPEPMKNLMYARRLPQSGTKLLCYRPLEAVNM